MNKTGRFIVKTRMTEATDLHLNRTGNSLERNNETRLCNHYCYGKATGTTYFECLSVALDIQHAMHMCHTVVCGLSGRTIFFHIISMNNTIFEKKVIGHKICFVFLQFLSEIFLILRKNERDMIIHAYWSSCKVPVIVV